MDYKIIRHAKGEERQNHKYVARVFVKKSSNGNDQYRYFYDQKTYNSYLKSKENTKKLSGDNIETKARELVTKGKDFAKNYVMGKGDAVINSASEIKESGTKFVKKVLTGGVGMTVAGATYNAVESIVDKYKQKYGIN